MSSTLAEVYKLPTPQLQLNRAISDYLYVSKNRKLYWDDASYYMAEEKGWNKLQEAIREHSECNMTTPNTEEG